MRPETEGVVKNIHKLFREKGLTLSIAESCTGGLISHYITGMGGASTFFKAAVVSYSEEIKQSLLGISPEIIRTKGVVSEETAREMAEKVRLLTKTDYSLSTTGNLGPGALEGKDLGLVYIAASRKGKTVSRELRLRGDRSANKEEASVSALKLLIEMME